MNLEQQKQQSLPVLPVTDATCLVYLFDGQLAVNDNFIIQKGESMVIENEEIRLTAIEESNIVLFVTDRNALVFKDGMYSGNIPKTFSKVLAAIGIATIFMFVANPLLKAAWKPVMDKIASLAPTGEWCTLPYGPDILIPAYISFIEPVLACLAMAILILNQLSKTTWLKFLLFCLIVLAVKYQLLMPVFYVALHKGNFQSNLASEGQFALETIALAITTGFTWQWS